MSEKIIDPMSLLSQVRPDADPALKRLFDMRLADELESQAREDRAKDPITGRPSIPDAQLVYDAVKHTTGVAVRGAKFICQLPKGYGGAGCELAMIPGDRLIVVQPDKQPLIIDPQTGTTRRL